MKPQITTNCDSENDTGDNIDEVPSFSLGLTRGDNIDGDDGNDNVEDSEFYIGDDHFEEILVEKSLKKERIKVNLFICYIYYLFMNLLFLTFLYY